MAWKRRLKPKFNAIAAVKTVETLHEAFVANRQGYRQQLWSILQTSQELIFKLRDNEKVQRRFLRKLADIEDRGAPEGDVNLALEVMTAITGDSRSGRKRASKYGVVLNILAEKGVPPGKTAEFIKAHGGIEKILRDNKPASQARARAVAHFAKTLTSGSRSRPAIFTTTEKCDARSTCGCQIEITSSRFQWEQV